MNEVIEWMPKLAGPCAKKEVFATLIATDGRRLKSSNFCFRPQAVCPRETEGYAPGEGYHLCDEVCNQIGHAEENVIRFAKTMGVSLAGATVYVEHEWICSGCSGVCAHHGVKAIIGKPPQ